MPTREEVKELLAAEKRTLQLLDTKLAELKALVVDDEARLMPEGVKEYPYLYGVVGVDGEPGILLNDFNVLLGEAKTQFSLAQMFEGRVDIQEDAPFVWTHLLMTQTFLDNQPIFGSIQNSSPLQLSSLLEIGIVENGSGRVLFQADRENEVGELVSTPMFDTQHEYESDEPDVITTLFRPGAYAQGHGPVAAFELPAETVLPASGSLTVQVKPAIYDLDNPPSPVRLYVALLGYKVFGD